MGLRLRVFVPEPSILAHLFGRLASSNITVMQEVIGSQTKELHCRVRLECFESYTHPRTL